MTEASDATYIGTELELFASAKNWKSYLGTRIRPHVGRRVLEVGAGLGGTTGHLISDSVEHWTCLEPDPVLAGQISVESAGPQEVRVVTGTISDIGEADLYDTIIYIDVIEHIEEDREELTRAWECLEISGNLIVLAPAHQWLMSEFDQAVGHFRRYNKASLAAIAPQPSSQVALQYLDTFGLLASLANKTILQSGSPNPGQVSFWDRVLVPISRRFDKVLGYNLGRSVLGIWRKSDARFAHQSTS
ncbi:MAG: methyltransferase type 12 [Alphaproteobacteria bacterium]|jgi:hypothetical protein|nr:methyltransferase type 12 [Alphaproteobacteria bacterium]|tara:strand:- start:1445 stop:2182 length:738 start_codon:yes stop_codon:yes gene_type:complete